MASPRSRSRSPARLVTVTVTKLSGLVVGELQAIVDTTVGEVKTRRGILRSHEFQCQEVEAPAVEVDWHRKRAVRWGWGRPPVHWDIDCGQILCSWSGAASQLLELHINWERFLAMGRCFDRVLRMWDVDAGAVLRELRGHAGRIVGFQVDWDAERALSWSHDRSLRLWDTDSGETVLELRGHDGPVDSAVMHME